MDFMDFYGCFCHYESLVVTDLHRQLSSSPRAYAQVWLPARPLHVVPGIAAWIPNLEDVNENCAKLNENQ